MSGFSGATSIERRIARVMGGSGIAVFALFAATTPALAQQAPSAAQAPAATAPTAQQDVAEATAEDIVVTGIRASLASSAAQKRNASGILDAISSEDLGKFPDANVAESLQRIPGVAIDRSNGEGQRVTVRGLGPDLNAVTINGAA